MTTPTWECLRDRRWMVVDEAALRLGVYPTADGSVALLYQPRDAQSPAMVTLCPDEIPMLCKQLACAQGFAERQLEANAEAVAAQATFDLLAKMKEAAK